ncbi:MAG: tetratricopeptide repeat protein [Bacteroidales bacterium]|nr:tetratricopeptide repeat protein [Bacteroidales bacterium]
MANNKNTAPETQNAIDNLNDSLTEMSNKVENNKKPIMIAIVAIVVVIGAVLLFQNHRKNSSDNANVEIGKADTEMILGNDSLALVQYMKTAQMGHDAGNRAALNAAIMLFNDKKYDEAIQYINKYAPKEAIVGAAAYSLKGDCYVNLDKLPDAVKAFKDAIKQSDKNPYYTPYFMLKLARVYRAQNDFNAELKLYEEVKKEYPAYAASTNLNIDKYIERARLSAGK